MNQQYFVNVSFFNSLETPITSAQTSKSIEVDTNYNIITIEVKNSASIEMYIDGCVIDRDADGKDLDDDEMQWIPISAINVSDFSIVNSITTNGIYQFSLQGLIRIRARVVSVSGNAQIVGIMEN